MLTLLVAAAAAFVEVVGLNRVVVHADTVDGLVGVAIEMLTLLVEVSLRVVRQGSQSTVGQTGPLSAVMAPM